MLHNFWLGGCETTKPFQHNSRPSCGQEGIIRSKSSMEVNRATPPTKAVVSLRKLPPNTTPTCVLGLRDSRFRKVAYSDLSQAILQDRAQFAETRFSLQISDLPGGQTGSRIHRGGISVLFGRFWTGNRGAAISGWMKPTFWRTTAPFEPWRKRMERELATLLFLKKSP